MKNDNINEHVIRKLPKDVINKISAGEVVTSPASVIKELVENAIDAGAKKITVAIKNGGKKEIIVTDDGSGIRDNEIEIAFMKNATSKIDSLDNLEEINTLGFRGEALFSITMVSKVSVITKHESQLKGSMSTFINGKKESLKAVASNKGTMITVKDIFYNTPARLKHLKSDRTEKNRSISMVSNLAISSPYISFKLISDGKEIFTTLGDGNIKNTLATIYGADFLSKMIKVDYEDKPLAVRGYILSPNYLDKQVEESVFIINGRYVKSEALNKAINIVYREEYGIFTKRISFILYIKLPYHMLDVNMHPAKTTVSFKNETLITMLICEGIRNALHEYMNVNEEPLSREIIRKEIEAEKEIKGEVHTKEIQVIFEEAAEYMGSNSNDISMGNDSLIIEPSVSEEKYISHKLNEWENRESYIKEEIVDRSIFDKIMNMKFIGFAFKAYALFESGDELYSVDTHAAHERVLYDKYKHASANGNIKMQTLVTPIILELPVLLKDIALNHSNELLNVGFKLDDYDSLSVVVSQIPEEFSIKDANDIFIKMLEAMKSDKVLLGEIDRREVLISTACHNAVRGKDDVTYDDVIFILSELRRADNPFTCPHSRPTIGRIRKKYFEKMFERV